MKLLSRPAIVFGCLIAIALRSASAQTSFVYGKILSNEKPVQFAIVGIAGTAYSTVTDSVGNYEISNLPEGKYKLDVICVGYAKTHANFSISSGQKKAINFNLISTENRLEDVVVTGTLKEVNRLETPVPVEVYTPLFFKKNPTPSIFDALQMINGVRPQLNCNVCNTGDIHINGLEGPYTMVLIDGMPIVSSLSTVYGLSGIPNSLVERIEVVKGPASSLYGSEAVGGLINIITKKPNNAPLFTADFFSTTWLENNVDLGLKTNIGKKATALTGVNYYNFQNIVDKNNDNFTDVTLQHRISAFQKWSFQRKDDRLFSVAARFFNEDRWGGDTRWTQKYRGGDSLYGESIYTRRWEFLGQYQLPVKEKIVLSMSYNDHDQNSYYGTTSYNAQQRIGFAQLTWDKKIGRNDFLVGSALRYTFYDDNTPATANSDSVNQKNMPQNTWLPGIFVQDEISLTEKHKLLLGFRYDYNSIHGNIYTPRFAYKWSINKNNIVRLNAGTGFRVVNLFTEDHAALTGARVIEITSELKPEQTYNVNLNYIKKIYEIENALIGIESSLFFTYFNNKIFGDYLTDPNKIIYDNLKGYAISQGLSTNFDVEFTNGLKIIAGGTYMDVSSVENGIRERQLLTERFTSTWAISYKVPKLNLGIDYTGSLYSPMRLPTLGGLDPRAPDSPWWSIQNIQLTYSGIKNIEIYGGIKNLLDWTPNKGNPFLIARTNDPFDKRVEFDANGQAVATTANPYALTFDPAYIYAPNQGIRGFFGARITIK
ncbi:MAG: TonB-dependent receptor [Cytophagales bacterium]